MTHEREMIHIEVSDVIQAPRDKVFEVNANYQNWTNIFPDMKSVRLIREEGEKTILEVDDIAEGVVKLTQRTFLPDRIEREINRHSLDGKATYTFEILSDNSSRMNLSFDVSLKGKYRLGSLFAKGIIIKRLKEFIFEPVKRATTQSITSTQNT